MKWKKLKNYLNSMKGILLFYFIIAILAFMLTKKIEDVNASNVKTPIEVEVYYA